MPRNKPSKRPSPKAAAQVPAQKPKSSMPAPKIIAMRKIELLTAI
jgi:hypothetical protein